MSDTTKRFCFAIPWALMVATNATAVRAQQAAPPPQPTAQTTPQTTGRAGPPPIPEPEPATTPTVALAPIDVPPSPSPASSERTSTQQSTTAPRRSVPMTTTSGGNASSAQRIAIAAAATTLVAGITELGVVYGLSDWVFNYPSPLGAPIFFSSALLTLIAIPATYWGVSRAFGGQGSYWVAFGSNLAGLFAGVGAAYGVALASHSSPIPSLLIYPVTVVAITALGYEASHFDATNTTRAQASNRTPIFPSIFASETTRGLTLSGSF